MGALFGGGKVDKGPSAAQIRAEEEEAARKRTAASLAEQEKKRRALRAKSAEFAGEEGDIQRKRLFGE